MSAYIGGCTLIGHDPDPESRDHNVRPGTWIAANCKESDAAHAGQEVNVWSSLIDMSGEYGEPRIFTEWGSKDGRTPVVADLRYIDSEKPCEHRVYRLKE
jgi:hypothetical protein